MVLDLHRDADDAGRPGLRRLGLHSRQRELAGLVDTLSELQHLLVLARLAERLEYALVGDVVDAGTEDERDRDRARGQQPEEVLGRQVRGERPAVGARSTPAAAAREPKSSKPNVRLMAAFSGRCSHS